MVATRKWFKCQRGCGLGGRKTHSPEGSAFYITRAVP